MVSESGYPSYLELLGAYFDGDLDLISGIGTDQNVNVGRVGGSINLHNADVAGWLELASVSEAGTISNGGSVSGWVRLGCSEDFDGTATFASVASTGRMYTHYSSDLTGDLTILGSMGGTISLARDLTSDGRISIGDDLTETGEIMVAGDVAGDIDIVDDVTGDITIDGDLSGDIDIDDAVSGGIEVQGTLKGSGRILIDGVCIGEITIGEQTEQLSQIVIYGGLDDFAGPPAKVGSITINADGGDFDANGTIHIGPSWTLPPPDVVFDGRILIQKQEEGVGGGDLGNRGRIEVFGCHATEDDLDICICGDVNGTIDIEQTGCTNQVTWDCLQEHPCFPDA
jgi:hypothetical protein